MFFMAENGIILFCKRHRWMKFKFMRGDKELSFKDVEITAHAMPEDRRIKAEPMPVMAYGQFRSKHAKCNSG